MGLALLFLFLCQVLTRGGFTGMEEITKYLPGGVHSENYVKASKGNHDNSDYQKSSIYVNQFKNDYQSEKNWTFVSFQINPFVNLMYHIQELLCIYVGLIYSRFY